MRYIGIINIFIKEQGRVIDNIITHNTGTIALQKILCNSFIGNYSDNNIPTYLGIYGSNDNAIKENIILTAKHLVEVKENDVITGYKVDFTASVISSDRNDIDIERIGLLSKNNVRLAYKDLILTDKSKINNNLKENREVVIDWSMTIDITETD